jgi:hypothetical protein
MKWDDGALSASKMTKGPSKNFFIEVNATDGEGWLVYDDHGKPKKQSVHMDNAKFANGEDQLLYFPNNHPTHPNQFKSMVIGTIPKGPDGQI